VSVHRVLIEADYQVDDIAMGADLAVTATDGEEGVATADDGLVGVVGVHVDAGEQTGERGCSQESRCPVQQRRRC